MTLRRGWAHSKYPGSINFPASRACLRPHGLLQNSTAVLHRLLQRRRVSTRQKPFSAFQPEPQVPLWFFSNTEMLMTSSNIEVQFKPCGLTSRAKTTPMKRLSPIIPEDSVVSLSLTEHSYHSNISALGRDRERDTYRYIHI